jgi:hypothetical protein
MNDDLLALFRQTGALLDRLLLVRSRLHSRQFFSAPRSFRAPTWRRRLYSCAFRSLIETFAADKPARLREIPTIKPMRNRSAPARAVLLVG